MKNIPIIVMIFAFAAFTGVAITGCKDSAKKADDVPDDVGSGKKVPGKGSASPLEELKADVGASIAGSVKYKGSPPAMEDDDRIAKSSDKATCLAGGGVHVKKQTWFINADKTVQNVLVFLAPPKGKKFATSTSPQTNKIIADQPFCNFAPHVIAVQSDLTPIVFKNSSSISHNVAIAIPGGDPINRTLGPKTESDEYKFKGKAGQLLDMTCSAHNWMVGKISVFEHPYFAVTDDKGNFEIKNAPVGVDLVLHYWHESFGGIGDKKGLAAKSYQKGDNKIEIELP